MALEDEVRAQTQSLDRLTDALSGRVNTSGLSGSTAASPNTSATSLKWLDNISSFSTNAVTALGKFTQGTYTASDGLVNFKQVLGGVLGPVGGVVGGLGEQVAEAGLNINRSLKDVSQSGAYFGNNLGLYDQAVLGARMSLPEFQATINRSSKSLAGLSDNMDKSSLVYLNTAKKIQETDIAYALQATGWQTEDFGKILTLVAHNSRSANMNTEAAQRNMIASTIALAVEMDNTARLAGISRKEQQDALEKQLKSKEMQLIMAAMDPEERRAKELSISQTLKYGEAVQNAVRIYATGGVTTAEEQRQVMSAGPLADYARQLAEIKGSTAEDNAKRDSILKKMDEVSANIASRDQSFFKTWAVQAKAGDDTTKAMAAGMLDITRYGQIQNQAAIEAQKAGITREAYLERETKKLEQDRLGAAKGQPGSEGVASLTSTTANRAERFMKDVSAGTGAYFNDLNTSLGSSIKSLDGFNNVLKKITQEQSKGVAGATVEKAKEATGVTGEVSVPITEKKPQLNDGTLGVYGTLFRDFGAKGTDVTLHGEEAVIPKKQVKQLESFIDSIVNTSKPTVKPIEKTAPSVSQISKQTTPAEKSAQKIEKPIEKSTIAKEPATKQVERLPAPGFDFANISIPFANFNKGISNLITDQQATTKSLLSSMPSPTANQTASIEKQLTSMINSMQSGLSFELEKNKPETLSKSDMQDVVTQLTSAASKITDETPAAQPVDTENKSMSEVTTQLVSLNTMMSQLLTHTMDVANNTNQQIRATRSLSGNLLG